jgi:pimeloyl-ACP methyl ester carboxylesterase
MKRKLWVRLVFALTALIVVGGGGVLLLRHQVATSLATDTPNGINESGYVQIGGIPQFVRIRGQDRANPVIFFLHGGPGGAVLSVSNQAFAPWERYFTVVHWDQRGSGLTYSANGYDPAETSIARLTVDGIQVAEYIKQRLDNEDLILVGHSWGSHLGFRIVQARPDLFVAYVATGLWVDFEESQARLYDAAIIRARAAEDTEAIQELETVARLPFDELERWKTILNWSAKPGDPTFPSDLSLFVAALLSPDYAPLMATFRRVPSSGLFTSGR